MHVKSKSQVNFARLEIYNSSTSVLLFKTLENTETHLSKGLLLKLVEALMVDLIFRRRGVVFRVAIWILANFNEYHVPGSNAQPGDICLTMPISLRNLQRLAGPMTWHYFDTFRENAPILRLLLTFIDQSTQSASRSLVEHTFAFLYGVVFLSNLHGAHGIYTGTYPTAGDGMDLNLPKRSGRWWRQRHCIRTCLMTVFNRNQSTVFTSKCSVAECLLFLFKWSLLRVSIVGLSISTLLLTILLG